MKDLYAKCGCNCGHCPGFSGNAKTSKDRQACSDGWAKYLGARLNPDKIKCKGCQAKDPWKTGNLLPSRGCHIRPCAVQNDFETCANCSKYPCFELENFIPGENLREQTEKKIGAKIPDKDYKAFLKPYEGLKNLKLLRKSLKPDEIKNHADVEPLRVRIAKFPDTLSLPKKELSAYKNLYGIMTSILRAQVDTYTRQTLIKRRKKHILSLLWLFGRYSQYKTTGGKHLLLNSEICDGIPDFGAYIRKYDKTIFATTRQCIRLLKEFGVNVDAESSKKGWHMKLSFAKKTGGTAELKALQTYTLGLVSKHGEAVYEGTTKYKGNSFKLFSKVDMSGLV